MKTRILASAFLLLSWPVIAAAQGLDTAKIDDVLGRSGQKSGDVYRVGFPRTDLHVSVDGVEVKPGLALGSWAAFAGTDSDASVMGDLVLLEDEVNPVMRKLRAAGFNDSAGTRGYSAAPRRRRRGPFAGLPSDRRFPRTQGYG